MTGAAFVTSHTPASVTAHCPAGQAMDCVGGPLALMFSASASVGAKRVSLARSALA